MAARCDDGASESAPRLTLPSAGVVPPSATLAHAAAPPSVALAHAAAPPSAALAHDDREAGEPAYDLFVVHAEADEWFVQGYLLPQLGLPRERVLLSGALALGAPLVAEIARGVSRSHLTLAVLSPAYLADRWAALGERLAAHARVDDAGLVPLLLEPCAPPLAIDALVSLDFCDRSRWDEQVERLRRRLQGPAPLAEAPAEAAPACPYPGMRPFGEQDQYVFFGRDREIEELHGRLHAGVREIYVIGPSGSGKSSLVSAGLVPSVHAMAGLFHPPFLLRTLRPGERPTDRLSEALGGAADAPGPSLDALLAGCPTAGRVLLLVDQLEEVFTLAKPAERRRFFAALRGLRADERCAFVFALRADFYGAMMESELWVDLQGQLSRLDVAPLRDDALADAIEKPARKAGVFLEPELVERLLADAANEPGALPLLQEALRLLWQKRRQRSLLLSSYRALGERGKSGLAVALSRRADMALRALTAPQQAIAKRIFLRLVSFGEGRADTRRQQPWGALLAAADDPDEAAAVLRKLTDDSSRLLTASGDGGDTRVDLSHEAILTAWPTLQEWVRARRSDEEKRRFFETKVREWVKRGRGESGLLDRVQLGEATQWRDSDAARELRYDRELPALIEASRRHLRKQRRLARGLSAGLVLFALVAWWQGLLASGSAREADNERLKARELLGKAYHDQGQQLLGRGHPLMAMPYLVEARRQGLDNVPLRSLFAEASRNLWLVQMRHGSAAVKSVAWSPDGTRIVTAGEDGNALLWDAAGSAAAIALAHQGPVHAAAFSPDGARVVTASADKTARVWDAATGGAVSPRLKHERPVLSAAFSPDGARVLSASEDGVVRIWDALAGTLVAALEADGNAQAAFSADGTRVITARAKGPVRLWDATTGALLSASTERHRGARAASTGRSHRFGPSRADSSVVLSVNAAGSRFVTIEPDDVARLWSAEAGIVGVASLSSLRLHTNAAFSPDGTRVVITGRDRSARIWDAATGKQFNTQLDHRDLINAVAWSPDGARLVTASADKTARLWDASGQPLARPLEHQRKVTAVAFSPDGARVVTASEDGVVRIWDASSRELAPPLGRGQGVTKAVFSPDGARVATAGNDMTARLWDAASGRALLPPLRHESVLNDVAFTPDGRSLLTAGADTTLRVWEAASGAPLGAPLEHDARVSELALSPDGTRVVTISDDRSVRVWHATSLAPVTPPLLHGARVRHAAWSPGGDRIITASDDGTARVWDAASGRQLLPALKHKREVLVASFSPDGARALTAGKDGVARVWNAASGQALFSLQHEDNVNAAAWSPDGKRIVTASTDTTARLWDAATGAELTPPLQHGKSVTAAVFSPDGARVVTLSRDSKAHLWDASSGHALALPMGHEDWPSSIAWSPDGTRLLATVLDGTAHVWDASPDGGSPEEWARLAQRCSSHALKDGALVANPIDSATCRPRPGPESAAAVASRASNLLRLGQSGLRHQRVFASSQLRAALALSRGAADELGVRAASRSLALLDALDGDLAKARASWGPDAPAGEAAFLQALASFGRRELHQPALAQPLLSKAIAAPSPDPELRLAWLETLLALRRFDEFAAAASSARPADEAPARRVAVDALSLVATRLAPGAGPEASQRLLRGYESLNEGDSLGASFEATRHALRYGAQRWERVAPLIELLEELEKPVSDKVKTRVRKLVLALAKPDPDPDPSAPASPAPR